MASEARTWGMMGSLCSLTSRQSPGVVPGSGKLEMWVWASISPGSTQAPETSSTWVPSGIATSAPTAKILPPSIRTAPLS